MFGTKKKAAKKQFTTEEKLEYYRDALAYLEGDAADFAAKRIEQLESALHQKNIYNQIRKAWKKHNK